MDKKRIIIISYLKGESIRQISKDTEVSRNTVRKYIREYEELNNQLDKVVTVKEKDKIIEHMISKPKYKAGKRSVRKLTDDIKKEIELLLEENKFKCQNGMRKQQLKGIDIYEALCEKGYEISYVTVQRYIRIKKDDYKLKEAYIKQVYRYGEIGEYDFGEVTLMINSKSTKCYMALMTLPKSNASLGRIYRSAGMESFLDSQVKFFDELQGVPQVMVYDNMRNAVKNFINRNERELTEDLMKISIYYGFDVRLTNPYSPQEKGHVENSVEKVRRKVFGTKYRFHSLEEANVYLIEKLKKINNQEELDKEKLHLKPIKPTYDVAKVSENKVDKYSLIQVGNNKYSVPEYLMNKRVTVKLYSNYLLVYSNNNLVCEHKKIDGSDGIQIDLTHYLNTLGKKPGALKNSLALTQANPYIKTIYHRYFIKKEREFIELIRIIQNEGINTIKGIINSFENKLFNTINLEMIKTELSYIKERNEYEIKDNSEISIEEISKKQLQDLSVMHGLIN